MAKCVDQVYATDFLDIGCSGELDAKLLPARVILTDLHNKTN